jgi:selenide,water dikinase
MSEPIRLTEYSHGAGCGCKIAPDVLNEILSSDLELFDDPRLLVGNDSRDDAAVYEISPGQAVISTTDFFMPIVDDPFDFGRVAATNAISDIYAMGGRPVMAIAILGWPLNKLPVQVAARVVDGGRRACKEAGIMLAGGHSIDALEPIFGLAVTGQVATERLKRNDRARAGSCLFLSKPLGVGILTTAQKRKVLKPEHKDLALDVMCRLNTVGADLAELGSVSAMTDVTGFGLLGHLIEICEGSDLQAEIEFDRVPCLASVDHYFQQGCTPGGTRRNFAAYGHQVGPLSEQQKGLLCDPQTSGGLLIAVDADGVDDLLEVGKRAGTMLTEIGFLKTPEGGGPRVRVV